MNRLLIANVLLTSSLLVSCTLAPFHHHSSIHPGLHGHNNPTENGNSGSSSMVTSASQANHVGPSITTTATMATTTAREVVRYTTTSPIDYCRGQPDNYAAVEPASKCRRYFRCANNSKSVYLCPGKLVFNGQRCVHPSDYQCHNSSIAESTVLPSLPVPSPIASPVEAKNEVAKNCDGRPDGYHQDGESGCRSYFYCTSGMKATYVCPGKTIFDGQRCVEPDAYTCPHNSSDCQLGDTTVSNGYQADLNSGCRNYYFCSGDGHKLITLTCSDDRLFDGKKCVDPDHYRCPSEHVTTTDKSKANGAASVQLDSYYSYSPQSPARKPSAVQPQTFFVISSRNSATTIRPQQQLSTNPSKDYCEKSYGFFAVPATGCRHYYMCIGGSRSDLQCSGDTIFNGQLCVDPSQYTCPESIHKADCQGKSDGVYPDKQSGCRNYFLCLGEVQTNLSCPTGQLFDGRRCADSRRVTCNDPSAVHEGRTNSMQSPCAGKTNGLYLDQSFPGCRGYLYCRAGRPYGPSGRCTRSERFSGQHSRCLPKHEVECRSSLDDNEDEEEDYMMAEASAMLVTIITDDIITTTPASN